MNTTMRVLKDIQLCYNCKNGRDKDCPFLEDRFPLVCEGFVKGKDYLKNRYSYYATDINSVHVRFNLFINGACSGNLCLRVEEIQDFLNKLDM